MRWKALWVVLVLALALGCVAAGHPKVDPGLLQDSPATVVPQEILPQAGVHVDGGLVLAVLEHEGVARELVAQLSELGGEPERAYDSLIEAWVPREILAHVAELPGVRYVRRPLVPVPLTDGPRLVSEGVVLLGASRFHAAGVLGQGAKVAVIDVGFGGLTNAHRAGEIAPEAVAEGRDYTRNGLEGGGPHGTGVAQIVHNMAPLAELHLARIGNEVQLDMAVRDCIFHGVDIIVHSVGWVNTGFGDGTGVIADIVRRATDAGILWVNAAGNHAQKHWIGEAHGTPGEWVELAPGVYELELKVEFPGTIDIALTWDEWPRAETDLDLFLLDHAGRVVASSLREQRGDAPPAEYLTYWADGGRHTVRVRWERGQEPVHLEIFSLGHEITPHVPEMSILAPGNAEDVLTVGAIGRANWGTGPQQPYSSQGPTSDGRLKPDIMGPDGVTNFAYPQFFGTSAAAPHVGGAAALLLAQARRDGTTLAREELALLLARRAVDMGEPGPNTVYGAGRARLFLEPTWAKRSILTPLPEGRVPQGGEFTVEVAVRMPATQLGGLELREELPAGLRGTIDEGSGAASATEGETLTWKWPLLSPGEELTVRYTVRVLEDHPPGEHTIDGLINSDPVKGASRLEVVSQSLGRALHVRCFPNPLAEGAWVRFEAEGVEVDELRLWVHDPSGRQIYDSGWQAGPTYQWNLQDDRGRLVPGGVYLYWLEVRTVEGQRLRSTIDRLLVLR